MDLTWTRSLLAIVEQGTLSGAALRLGVSQSALSRRVQQLEQEMGAELLERQGRGVALSEAGELFVQEGKILVERYDRLKRSIEAQRKLETGVVRIGAGATAISALLPSAMARFRRRFPRVRFRLEEGGSRQIEAATREDRVDVGIVTLPAHSKEVLARRLARDRIVLVAALDHPWAGRKWILPEELVTQEVIGFEAGSAIRQLIDEALSQASVELQVVMEVRSLAAIFGLLDSTASLAFVSEWAARGRPVLEVRGVRIERELGLIVRAGRTLPVAAQAFIRELDLSAQALHRASERACEPV